MLKIVVPMAGRGSRFSTAGYPIPKPLILVNGEPMIKLVIQNITPNRDHKFIFVCQNTHISKFNLHEELRKWSPDCELIGVEEVTLGPAATVLKAKEMINDDFPLIIANSDQLIESAIDDYLEFIEDPSVDGCIMTMTAYDPKWSFVRTDNKGRVLEVAEKRAISNEATIGIYGFKRGSDFVKASERMIEEEALVNGEAYVAPTYNYLIQQGLNFSTVHIGTEGNGMHGLGTPEDLQKYILNTIKVS